MTPVLPRTWVPDALVAAAVVLIGLVVGPPAGSLLVLGVAAAAAGLSRPAPAAALALGWFAWVLQIAGAGALGAAQLGMFVVAFGTARWGGAATVWAGGLSIPLWGLIWLHFGRSEIGAVLRVVNLRGLSVGVYRLEGGIWRPLAEAVLAALVLGTPWLAGLALRAGARARSSGASQRAAEADAARAHREFEQARQIAVLREEQARLARDVHDVVGHSLAVILAQAESAQFLQDADTQGLKQTMATIATSARASLQDVRQVLSTTSDQSPQSRPGGLQSLIDGLRASGHEVVSAEVGHPQPLPPELDMVAYRVLQEMLTNAIKHGRRDTAVSVERHWEGELRIEVRNVIDVRPGADPVEPSGGQGIDGMRRRLEAAGGRLDVRRRDGGDDSTHPTYTATAWLPVRGTP